MRKALDVIGSGIAMMALGGFLAFIFLTAL